MLWFTGQEKSYGAANLSQLPVYTGIHFTSICWLYKIDTLQSLLKISTHFCESSWLTA